MSFILDKLRKEGQSGLNQTGNTAKMTAVITAPFAIGYLVIQLLVPEELTDLSILLFFVGWIAYILVLYAQMKAKAASYVVFPQSHWFFGTGQKLQQVNFDLFLPPESWKRVYQYPDESELFRVQFKDTYSHQSPDRPTPDYFNEALWKLPASWTKSFDRNGSGEFFFENMFVESPTTENIEVTVVDWQERGSSRVPLCIITGCSYYARQILGTGGVELPTLESLDKLKSKQSMTPIDKLKAQVLDLQAYNRELEDRNGFLERENNHYANDKPENIRKLTEKNMEANRKRYKNIMDTKGSLWSRITNLRTLGVILLAIVLILLATHFWFGYP